MKKSYLFNLTLLGLYSLILVIAFVIDALWMINNKFITLISAISILFLDKFFLSNYLRDIGERDKLEQQVQSLYDHIMDFISYLKSTNYENHTKKENERIKFEIKFFEDNDQLLRKYFGFHISDVNKEDLSPESPKFEKKISFRKGRFSIFFKTTIPYNCWIYKEERMYSQNINKANQLLDLLTKELIAELKSKFKLKICSNK